MTMTILFPWLHAFFVALLVASSIVLSYEGGKRAARIESDKTVAGLIQSLEASPAQVRRDAETMKQASIALKTCGR
jgi:hypothetical protein